MVTTCDVTGRHVLIGSVAVIVIGGVRQQSSPSSGATANNSWSLSWIVTVTVPGLQSSPAGTNRIVISDSVPQVQVRRPAAHDEAPASSGAVRAPSTNTTRQTTSTPSLGIREGPRCTSPFG
jgi:hypothetical protein